MINSLFVSGLCRYFNIQESYRKKIHLISPTPPLLPSTLFNIGQFSSMFYGKESIPVCCFFYIIYSPQQYPLTMTQCKLLVKTWLRMRNNKISFVVYTEFICHQPDNFPEEFVKLGLVAENFYKLPKVSKDTCQMKWNSEIKFITFFALLIHDKVTRGKGFVIITNRTKTNEKKRVNWHQL